MMAIHVEQLPGGGERVSTTSNGHRPEHASPLDRVGGPSLELGLGLRPDLRAAIGELVTQLRVVCNSMVPSDHPRAYCITSPGTLRSLREVSEVELCDAIRKAERFAPSLTIPGDGLSAARRLEDLLQRLAA